MQDKSTACLTRNDTKELICTRLGEQTRLGGKMKALITFRLLRFPGRCPNAGILCSSTLYFSNRKHATNLQRSTAVYLDAEEVDEAAALVRRGLLISLFTTSSRLSVRLWTGGATTPRSQQLLLMLCRSLCGFFNS